jgi:hypothetical protein
MLWKVAKNLSNYIDILFQIYKIQGSALDALSSMQSFLKGRPQRFDSIEQAIEYK